MKIIITEQQYNLLREQNTSKKPIRLQPLQNISADNTAVKKIQIPNEQHYKIKACKNKYSSQALKQAVDWWKNWLNNYETVRKFTRNWKMVVYDWPYFYNQYKRTLDEIKLKFVDLSNSEDEEANSTIAWVESKNYFGNVPLEYKNIIFINCGNEENNNPVETLIHEIQHILFMIKPLHPEQNISKDLNFNLRDEESIWTDLYRLIGKKPVSSDSKKINLKNIENDMKKEGIKDVQYYIEMFNQMEDERIYTPYRDNPTEIMSRIYELRKSLNLVPEKNIPIKEFVRLVNEKKPGIAWMVLSYIKSGKTLREFLGIIDSYAKNDKNQKNISSTFQV